MNKYLRANYFFLIFLVIIISVPTYQSFGQIQTDTGEGVFFVNTHPYSFKDNNGYTVVVGEIFNNHSYSIHDVKILVSFYDEISDDPIDSVIGSTILNSVSPYGNSPFILKSSMPDSSISRVGVTILGADSSPEKQFSILIKINSLEINNSLNLSGQITNNGNEDITNVKIHLVSNDIFEPPRILNISTINLENTLSPGNSQTFSIKGFFNSKSVNHYVLAESENYLSEKISIDDQKIISHNKIFTINEITLTNIKQNNSIIFSPIQIEAEIFMQEFTQLSLEESYVFYVQIKNAESGLVEFIDKSESTILENSPKISSTLWIPENEGLFFIETYLWDNDNVVLSSPGKILLVHVNAE